MMLIKLIKRLFKRPGPLEIEMRNLAKKMRTVKFSIAELEDSYSSVKYCCRACDSALSEEFDQDAGKLYDKYKRQIDRMNWLKGKLNGN